MKRSLKKIFLIMTLGMLTASLSSCVYYGNKKWSDMTLEEKKEVKQNLAEIKDDLEEDFSGNGIEGEFVSFILNTMEHVVKSAE